MTSLIVAGATGLVGREVLRLLGERAGLSVRALVRRPGSIGVGVSGEGTTVTETVFDYDDGKAYGALFADECNAIFSCLGTTRKKAGSDEAFRRVDLVYPERLLEAFVAARSTVDKTFALVSSVGAPSASGLYLRTKWELEIAVQKAPLRHVIVRPSLLAGEREESRLGERLGLALTRPFAYLGQDLLGLSTAYKYGPIRAEQVARALVTAALDGGGESVVLEGRELHEGSAASQTTR